MWMVYSFTDKLNGKRYIGTTNDLNMRVSSHLWKSAQPTTKFHKALRERGVLGFILEVLEEGFVSEDDAIQAEIRLIAEHGSYTNGYNSNRGGYGQPKGSIPWNKGKKGIHSAETLLQLSKRRLGVPTTPRGATNPKSADNARRGAAKQRANALGRRRYQIAVDKWTWMYPREDGTWYIKQRQTPNSKWREVDVNPPLN